MPRQRTYYLSRITKEGRVTSDSVTRALSESPAVIARGYRYQVVDTGVGEVQTKSARRYLYGYLAKYRDTAIETIDEEARATRTQEERNAAQARCLFVYFPDDAIFAHQKIWNAIGEKDFRRRVSEIILDFHQDGFFANCEINAISDYQKFIIRLQKLDSIHKMTASVVPPNPLFGELWKSLRDYLRNRNLKKLRTAEEAVAGQEIQTDLVRIISELPKEPAEVSRTVTEPLETPSRPTKSPAALGDAAVLMAADGYGKATVVGFRKSTYTTVRTSDSAVTFSLPEDAPIEDIAYTTSNQIDTIQSNRGLMH